MAIFAFAAEAVSLSVEVSDADLRPGDKTTATVKLNNYADNWSAMSVDVKYDAGVFELDGALEHGGAIDFKGFGGQNALAEIFEVTPGTIRVVWMDGENITFNEENPLITLRLIAKGEVSGNVAITAAFLADGQISMGSDGTPEQVKAGSDTFTTTAVSSDPIVVGGVAWSEQPAIRLEVEKTRPQSGRPFKATVYIDKYMPWDTLTVDFAFPEENLEIQSVQALGFGSNATFSGKTVTIANGSDYAGEGTVTAFEVTFMPKAVSQAFDLTATFGSGCHSSKFGNLQGDVHFKAQGSSKSVTVVPAKTLLEVVYAKPEEAANLKAGDTFDVYVKLKEHENEWTAFTLVGNYDASKFKLEEIDTDSYVTALGVGENEEPYTVVTEQVSGQIEAVWISTANIKTTTSDPTLMKLTFRALKAGAANISFSFKEDGVIADQDGTLTEQEKGDNFTEEDVGVDVNVAPKPMQIVSRVEGNLTSVEAGHTVDIILSVQDCYEALAALSIKGDYDKDVFELDAVTPLLTTFGENGQVISPDIAAGDDLEIVWIGTENVELPTSFDAVKITLKAKQAASTTAISFSFIDGGILNIGADGMPVALKEDSYYKSEPEVVKMTVLAPSVDLDVRTEAKNVAAGEEFLVDVYVTDYFAPLAGFAIKGNVNSEYFEVLEILPETVGGIVPIQDENNKTELEFVWFDSENIQVNAEEFKVLTLKVRAKKSAAAAQAITFDYMDGGMVRIDGGAPVGLVRGDDFAQQPAEVQITIEKVPAELGVTFDKEQVRQGEEVTVTVDLKYYESDWVALSFKMLFDTDKFEYVEGSTLSGGMNAEVVSSVDNATNPLAFSLLNTDLLPIEANFDNATLVSFKLKAKEDAALGETTVRAQFMEGGILDANCNGVAHDGTAYKLEAASQTIEILEGTLIEVTVTWGELSYVYNYGVWNPESHLWVGGEWTIAEDGEDVITVANTGSVDLQAGFTYQTAVEGLRGAFALEDGNAFIDPIAVDASESKKVYFSLRGKTEDEWEDTISVGTITVTIDTADDGGAA
jgi:hypothetical protein